MVEDNLSPRPVRLPLLLRAQYSWKLIRSTILCGYSSMVPLSSFPEIYGHPRDEKNDALMVWGPLGPPLVELRHTPLHALRDWVQTYDKTELAVMDCT